MQYLGLAAFIGLTAAAAAFGATFEPGAWYAGLAKPWFTPPAWLFAPVWTVLYVMIAVAGWLVWRERGMSPLVGLWGLQLVLNAAWSWLMFGRHEIGLALLDIVLLLLTISLFAVLATKVSRAAAMLFVPYVAWVAFASALNFGIWRLNP